jgi:hypothetical protein
LAVLVIHATKKLLDRVGGASVRPTETSTTTLGSWYATLLLWKPQVVLFVNAGTLLPMLTPLAPARSLVERFAPGLKELLLAHGVDGTFVSREIAEAQACRFAKTNNRSVVGSMNDFSYLAEAFRGGGDRDDLLTLSLRLSETPCSPLYNRHITPAAELRARLSGP